MQKIKLLSISGTPCYSPCVIRPWSIEDGKVKINLFYSQDKNNNNLYNHYFCESQKQISCDVNEEHKDIFNQLSLDFIYEMIKHNIRNKNDINIILYDLIKTYTKSNIINIGESEMLLIGDCLLTKEDCIKEDADLDLISKNPRDLNLRVYRVGIPEDGVFYERNFGNILLPDDWDIQKSGNAAITRRIKKNGPVWSIIQYKVLFSKNKKVPCTVGYAAPLSSIFEAKEYFAKNKNRLQKEKFYRSLDKAQSELFFNDKNKDFLKSLFNDLQDKM